MIFWSLLSTRPFGCRPVVGSNLYVQDVVSAKQLLYKCLVSELSKTHINTQRSGSYLSGGPYIWPTH